MFFFGDQPQSFGIRNVTFACSVPRERALVSTMEPSRVSSKNCVQAFDNMVCLDAYIADEDGTAVDLSDMLSGRGENYVRFVNRGTPCKLTEKHYLNIIVADEKTVAGVRPPS